MFPPFLSGFPAAVELEMTAAFLPLLMSLIAGVSLVAFGFAVYVWCSHLVGAPLQKAAYPRRFVCPIKHQTVEVRLIAWKGQPWHVLDVERCSGWCLGVKRDCNKECMSVFDGPPPGPPLLLL